MPKQYVTILGKAVRSLARLRGGGSALPGLFVERIDPQFIARALASLPRGVVVISGTNGKTTTTKMVVELLESQGLKVFTNKTGSNFTRGVAAALLGDVDLHGTLHADIAVLELDEAHGVHFVRHVKPRFSLFLNVMRDQLDRFGEIDATARLLQKIADATTDTVVLNREDARIRTITAPKKVFFGLSDKTRHLFPGDDDMRGTSPAPVAPTPKATVILDDLKGQTATFREGGKQLVTPLKLQGIYNIYNAAAALALVNVILGEQRDRDALIRSLAAVTPAFGRGEKLTLGGQPLELVLVKNPSGFRLGLQSFPPEDYATMITVNDNYADGRDMSWLWDVDFDSLKETGVDELSGIRAYDMALRLQYDEIKISHINPDLKKALHHFITSNTDKPKRIYCTYTTMLALRRELGKLTKVEAIS